MYSYTQNLNTFYTMRMDNIQFHINLINMIKFWIWSLLAINFKNGAFRILETERLGVS